MREVDPPAAIKGIKALYHIIWLARAHHLSAVRNIARSIPPRGQCRHGPEPSLLRTAEWLGAELDRGVGLRDHWMDAGEGGHLIFPTWLHVERERTANTKP